MANETIDFDHIDRNGSDNLSHKLSDGYDGMHWKHIEAFDPSAFPGSGYQVGVHSGTSVGFNVGGKNASFSSDATFTLVNGYFTAGFAPETATLTAYLEGEKVGKAKLHVTNEHQKFFTFDDTFAHIDEVRIKTGGTNTQLAMDDLFVKFDGPIPTEQTAGHGISPVATVGFASHIALPEPAAMPHFSADFGHWVLA